MKKTPLFELRSKQQLGKRGLCSMTMAAKKLNLKREHDCCCCFLSQVKFELRKTYGGPDSPLLWKKCGHSSSWVHS
jgi:hypothetical protein